MSNLYNLQQIKLGLLTMFASVRRSGESARHSGTFRLTLAEGTPAEAQIEFDAWLWELQEKDQEKWLAKDKRRTLDYCPSLYIGAESKQKAAFFVDPVETAAGECPIDSGKIGDDSTSHDQAFDNKEVAA